MVGEDTYGNKGVMTHNRLGCVPSVDPPPSPPCQAYFDNNMVSDFAPAPFETARFMGTLRGEPKYTPQFYASGLSTLQFDPVDGTGWAGRWSVNVEGFYRCTWSTAAGQEVPVIAFHVTGQGYLTNNYPIPAGTLVGTTLISHSTSPYYLGYDTNTAVAFNLSDLDVTTPYPPAPYGTEVPGSDGLAPALPLHLGRFKFESLNLTTLEPLGTLLEADVWVWA